MPPGEPATVAGFRLSAPRTALGKASSRVHNGIRFGPATQTALRTGVPASSQVKTMILPSEAKITTDLLWRGAVLFAGLDIVLVSVLVWRVRPGTLRRLRGEVIATTALFWCGLWFWAVGYFWDPVYQYLFPAWSRWLIPFLQAALTVLVAALAWSLSGRLRVHPILSYCLLGGLWGMLSHLGAVALGIVDKPPLLQGTAPIAAIVVAIFEFTLYWCVILIGALVIRGGRRWVESHLRYPPLGLCG